MRYVHRIGVCALLAAWVLSPFVLPEARATTQPSGGERVGVVLSGGAAKGLAHIGVLQALETMGMPIHYVTGNSIGGLVGALYAMGYGATEVENLLSRADWGVVASDDVPRTRRIFDQKRRAGRHLVVLPLDRGVPRLPLGLLDGQRLWQLLARLTWPVRTVRDFRTLPIPFAAVATDIETGDAVVLDHGDLADVLRATMSVPGLFAPVQIEGQWLIDGMLVRNLPAREAHDLGADLLICSDVSEPLMSHDSLASVVDILDQITSFRSMEALLEDRARCDVLLQPNTVGLRPLSFTRIPDWTERGRMAVEGMIPELSLIRDRAAAAEPRAAPTRDAVRVANLEINPPDRIPPHQIRRGLGLRLPDRLSVDEIDDAIDRVYGTGHYRTVTYAFERVDSETGATLVIRPDDSVRPALGFGVRYESRNKASFLLSVMFDHLLSIGSRTEIDLRLGRPLQLTALHVVSTGPFERLTLRLGSGVARLPFDAFGDGRVISSALVDVWNSTVFAGLGLSRAAVAGIELRSEYLRARSAIPESDVVDDRWLGTVSGIVSVDTRDDDIFPRAGFQLDGRAVWARRGVGSRSTFAQQIAQVGIHIPIANALSLKAEVVLGRSTGSDLPPHYFFHLGGASSDFVRPLRQFPFLGYAPQELAGANAQIVGAGLQYAIADNVFVLGRWNAGNTFDDWEIAPEDYVHGVGLTTGARTVVGYLALTVSGRDTFRQPRIEIDLGFPF